MAMEASLLRQRDGVSSPVLDDQSDCFGSTVEEEENNHRPPSTIMWFHSCRRRCKRLHPGSISNLCSATLGAGALSLPFAISLTGIVFGVLLLILSAYLTIVSIDVIVEACVRTQLFKYEDVSVRLVGKRAGMVLEISLLIFCFGTAVAYIVAVGDILDQGLRSMPDLWEADSDEENNAWSLTSIYSRERVMIFFWGVVMFPLSLQKHVEALERFSSLGVMSIIFLVLAAVIHCILHGDAMRKSDHSQTEPTDISSMLWPKSFWDVVQAFPIIIFAFSCQVNVCAIYEELSTDASNSISDVRPALITKQQIMSRITKNGILLCMTLYILIGLFGFLDFSHATVDNILNNYCIQATHDSLMTAASAFVAVAVVVAFPFNILPARVTLKLILERVRRRRRCGRCYRFFSSLTCSNCLFSWPGLKVRPHEANTSVSMEVHEAAAYSSEAVVDGPRSNEGVIEPLLGEDRFGDTPYLVPHMSLEGFPAEVEEEVYSTESSPAEHFLLTLLLSGSALIVALLIPGISVVFGLMGGTAASIISFILPGMFLLDANATNEGNPRLSKRSKLLAHFFVWGGTLIGVLSTGVTIYGLFIPNDTSAVDTCGDGGSTPAVGLAL
ncbi:hypothetical protein ACHAXR_006596 [Thalassiosira sp. AJA248-18]